MIFVPAVLSFGVQFMTTGIGFGAALAMIANRLVEAHLSAFDGVLAFAAIVIGMDQRNRDKPRERRRQYCRDCRFAYSLNQEILLSSARLMILNRGLDAEAAGNVSAAVCKAVSGSFRKERCFLL